MPYGCETTIAVNGISGGACLVQAGTLYNVVGFQTNLRYVKQDRAFRIIPGLEHAEFLSYGQMHRNAFVNAPLLLEPTMAFRGRTSLFFAGRSPAWRDTWAVWVAVGRRASTRRALCGARNRW